MNGSIFPKEKTEGGKKDTTEKATAPVTELKVKI